MSKSLGGLRMPISVAEGNRRPYDLVQAAKLASEAGVVVRHEVPSCLVCVCVLDFKLILRKLI